MFYSLFRLLGALAVAAVVGFGVFVIGAVSVGNKPTELHACGVALVAFAAAVVAFVWMFRRMGTGKLAQWRAESQIRELKAQAVKREIGPEATLVAIVLGGGSYVTTTLRASWDGRDSASVDAVVEGAWRTVFTGRFHPEVPGQVVPSTIRPSVVDKDSYSVSTTRAGYKPARWEVLAYIPGDWEEELHRLWEAAKQAQHEREKDRFGL